MKKLLILGGPVQAAKAVRTAKEMGIYVIVTDIDACDIVRGIADEILPFSVADIKSISSWVKEHPVDGILNFCVDLAQKPQYYLCKEFNLPCFGTLDQIEKLSNKDEFKKICIENGADIIRSYKEEDITENFKNYPLLIKPSQSSGSRGSSVCRNYHEFLLGAKLAHKETTNGQITIEDYMEGKQDFAVEYLFIDGHLFLIKTSDRYLGREEDGLNRQAIAIVSPSKYTDFYVDKIEKNVVKMLKSIGIKNGVLFMQGFVDNDTIRFYDPAYRFPGTEYENSLVKATKLDTVRYAIDFAVGNKYSQYLDDINKPYLLNNKIAISMMIAVRPGKICQYDGFDVVAKFPYVVTVSPKKKNGSIVPQTGSVLQRSAEIGLLLERDVEAISKAVNDVYQNLHILNENMEDMIISKFDNPRLENVLKVI